MSKLVKRILSVLLMALMALLLLPLGLFSAVGAFDETHVIYALQDELFVEGAIVSPMDGNPRAMFEIPAEQSAVTIVPLVDNATFHCYGGASFSFGEIEDGTIGIFTLATAGNNPTPPSLTITQIPVQDHTLTINTNDGSTALATVTQAMKSAYTLPFPERDGYSFRGWALNGGGGVSWGRGQGMIYVFGTGDGTVTAQWRKLVTIAYDTDDGSPALEPRVLMSGVPDLLPAAPTKSGYTFTGWKAGDTIFAAGAEYTVTDDVTFTAQWMVAVDVTITYKTDGGSPAEIAPVTVPNGTSIKLPAAPTKSGNIFMGWKTGSATLGAGESYTVTGDVTFTAQWAKTIFGTNFPSTIWNWFVFIALFGWVWMWFI